MVSEMATESTQSNDLGAPSRVERSRRFVREIPQNRNAVIGLSLLIPIFLSAILAPVLATHDPTATNYGATFASPSAEYLFGTDQFGRDLFSRTLYGGRSSLLVGVGSVALALSLGVPIGLFAGYRGGRTDEVVMRGMDILMTFPTILLALLLLVTLTPSIWAAMVAVGVVFAPRIARVVRASTLSVKSEEFVKAAEQRGETTRTILFREILPNIRGPILVEASIRVGYGIMTGAALSFLGLGVQPPTPDWGYMVATARNEIHSSVWFLLWPSLVLSASILGFNLLGDGLSDIFETEVDSE